MTLSNIIISDLVPLSQRGLYQGLIGLTFALASAIGPPIVSHVVLTHVMQGLTFIQGGALAEKASWRWLFCEYPGSPHNASRSEKSVSSFQISIFRSLG